MHLPRPAFVYFVSNKSRTLYCGITTDLRARFEEGWSRAKKIALIQATNPDWIDLSPRLDPLYWFA